MSLTQVVTSLLEQTTLVRIKFSLAGCQINSSGFRRVAEALKSGDLTVEQSTEVPDGIAVYRPSEKKMIMLVTPTETNQQALILHECAHALVDMQVGSRRIAWELNESCGYLVHALYMCLEWGDKFRTRVAEMKEADKKVFSAALQIIDTLGLLHLERELSDEDAKPLADAIREHPLYERHRRAHD